MLSPAEWLFDLEKRAGGGNPKIGRDIVLGALGVKSQSLSNARNSGSFPARWFVPLWRINSGGFCLAVDRMPPVDFFAWAGPRDEEREDHDAPAQRQDRPKLH